MNEMDKPAIASGESLVDLVHIAIALGIAAAGFLSVVYIFVGGISFILSGGQEEKIKQAVSTIRYAIIGLIVVIFSVAMVRIVGAILDIEIIPYFQWDKMIELLQNIMDRVFGDAGSSGGSRSL